MSPRRGLSFVSLLAVALGMAWGLGCLLGTLAAGLWMLTR